jgi:predicted dehydrogenase
MNHSFRAAMIGTGFMGRLHVESLRRAGVEVIGMLGSTPEKGAAFAKSWNIPRAYRSLDDLLADREVDVVHIGTPNQMHFEQARRSILAGKHVLCEKPLAMTCQESQALLELEASHPNVVCGVNYNIRFYPLCLEMQQRVANGDLGDVFHLQGCYVQDWLHQPTDYNWRVLSDQGGLLRSVSDIGTHWLDLAVFVTGLDVQSVCADLATIHRQRKRPLGEVETFTGKQASMAADATESLEVTTDDYGAIMLRFRGGARGIVCTSQVTAGRKNMLRLEIAGSKTSMCWESERPEALWIGHRPNPNQWLIRDPSLLTDVAAGACSYPGGHGEGYGDSFKQCFREFYGYLAGGDFKSPRRFATFADGHRELKLCDAILESHRRGTWVDVS